MPTPNTSNKKAKLNPNGLKRVFKMVWNDYKWLIIIIAILVCVIRERLWKCLPTTFNR